MLGQQQDILRALTQRGKCERHHSEPVVEIASEASCTCRGSQVLVRGGDELDVDALGARGAETADRLFFDHLQELCLQALGQQRDFVEKEGSPVRGVQQPGFRASGVSERATLEAE